MISVISYARISSIRSGTTTGTDDQHAVNTLAAQAQGARVVGHISDNGVSASGQRRRPGFEQLLETLDVGTYQNEVVHGVVASHEDRLARNAADWYRLLVSLKALPNGRLMCRGAWCDLTTDTAMRASTDLVLRAAREIQDASRRQTRSHQRRAELGEPAGGNRPFGWTADRRTLDPAEAEIGRALVTDFLRGHSINGLTRRLIDEQVTTTLGNPWTSSTLRVFLRNSRLCGWRSLRGEVLHDDQGQPVVGKWEPLISPSDWLACQTRFHARDPAPGHPRSLLTGIARCGAAKLGRSCDRPLTVQRPARLSSHLYTCPGRQVGGCGGVGRNGRALDAFVTACVRERLTDWALPVHMEVAQSTQLDLLLRQRSALTEAWECGALDKSIDMTRRLAGIERDIENAIVSRRATGSRSDVVAARWDRLSPSEHRLLVAASLTSVRVLPIGKGRRGTDQSNVRLSWRQPHAALVLAQLPEIPVPT